MMEQIDPRTHPFYRAAVGSSILSLAVHAPQGKPPNSSAFLERINAGWLTATYATDAQAMREIQAVLPHIAGLQLVMAGFFRGIAGGLDGSWAFEDKPRQRIPSSGVQYRLPKKRVLSICLSG